MKAGWIIRSLGDVGKVSMCKRVLKKQTNTVGGIPFYKIGTFGKEPNAYIDEELYNEFREKYSFPKKGDILLSASGTIGRRVVYDGKPAYFQDSNIVWIDNDESEVLNEYLYKFYGHCKWNASKGATISRLYNDDLRRIQIPIPPLEEQKQIVSILDEAFEAIDQAQENIERNIENAKELFQSKLNDIFSQKGEGWEERSLGEVSTVLNGFAFKSKDTVTDSDTQLLRMGNLYKNVLDLTRKPVFYPDKFATDYNKYVLNAGDLIMSLTGTVDKTDYGYTVEVPETNINLLLNQRIMKIDVIDEDALDKKFLRHYLQSKAFLETLYATASGTRQANLSSKTILTLVINFPKDLAKQEELVYLIEALKDFTLNLEIDYQQKLTNLEDLKKSLLEQAFAGKLTCNEPNPTH